MEGDTISVKSGSKRSFETSRSGKNGHNPNEALLSRSRGDSKGENEEHPITHGAGGSISSVSSGSEGSLLPRGQSTGSTSADSADAVGSPRITLHLIEEFKMCVEIAKGVSHFN